MPYSFGEFGGDVVGPGSAVDEHMALFDGTSGKLLKDGGAKPGGNVGGPTSAIDGHPALFDGATGKILKDGGAASLLVARRVLNHAAIQALPTTPFEILAPSATEAYLLEFVTAVTSFVTPYAGLDPQPLNDSSSALSTVKVDYASPLVGFGSMALTSELFIAPSTLNVSSRSALNGGIAAVGLAKNNAIELTVVNPAGAGRLVTFSIAGTAPAGTSALAAMNTSAAGSNSGAGADAAFDVSWTGGLYAAVLHPVAYDAMVTFNQWGHDFTPGDVLVFDGTLFGGTTIVNDLTLTVLTVQSTGGNFTGGNSANTLTIELAYRKVTV
jgi:hypothetical protein